MVSWIVRLSDIHEASVAWWTLKITSVRSLWDDGAHPTSVEVDWRYFGVGKDSRLLDFHKSSVVSGRRVSQSRGVLRSIRRIIRSEFL